MSYGGGGGPGISLDEAVHLNGSTTVYLSRKLIFGEWDEISSCLLNNLVLDFRWVIHESILNGCEIPTVLGQEAPSCRKRFNRKP